MSHDEEVNAKKGKEEEIEKKMPKSFTVILSLEKEGRKRERRWKGGREKREERKYRILNLFLGQI